VSWLAATLLSDAAHAEPFCDALLEGGALSASIEDADAGTPEEQAQFGEPGSVSTPGWQHSRIVALFDANADIASIVGNASALTNLAKTPVFSVKEVAEENWVQLTQSQFDPIRISPRLWIVPSWHQAPDPLAINLVLDPGMAFGTGAHPTTRLCLQWLEQEVTPAASLLDYGCGSGILAIAAARFGAQKVCGVDIDPQAIVAARHNAEANSVEANFADASEVIDEKFDLVVANILANPLRVLAPAICNHLRPGGKLALAGLLSEQAEELIEVYRPWLALTVFDCQEGWACLAGEKA